MILKYGSYSYGLHGAGITIQRRAKLNEAQQPIQIIVTINVMTRLINTGSTVESMNALVAAFEAAHKLTRQNLILYQADGTTETVHAWRDNQVIGGVRVVGPPSYPEYQGAEGINYRTIQVQFETIEPINGSQQALLSFTESISFSGGGRRFGLLEPIQGQPVKQLLKQQTIYRATQRGSAVALYSHRVAPAPLWPDALVEEPGEVEYTTPNRIGSDYMEFATRWNYEFASATPLFGRPTIWS